MTLRQYHEVLLSPPEPLTRVQQRMAVLFGLLIGWTRTLSLSQTLWDWDEAQFCSAVRSYDVSLHHPHPPGYPLFIASAKLLRPLMSSDFRSLQAVVLIAALLLFPAFFVLLRELRFAFVVSLGGATLLCFIPTVWYHGGTAFSDIPALTLVLTASAMLLRSCCQPRFFVVGSALLGAALAFRPLTLLIALVPLVAASWSVARRSVRVAVSGAAVCAAIVLASYAGAALASGSVQSFVHAVEDTSVWVRSVDSYHNPARPRLPLLFVHFLIQPIGGGHQRSLVAVLALISLLASIPTRRVEVWILTAMFVPIAVVTWLILDINAATRYAIAYVPLYSALSVDGLVFLTSAADRLERRIPAMLAGIVVAVIVARSIWWTLPALRIARSTPSPPAASMLWIRGHVAPSLPLYVHGGLDPFADYFLPRYSLQKDVSARELPHTFSPLAGYYAMEGGSNAPQAVVFTREHGRLWNIARQRYFEVSVLPLSQSVYFGGGWYEAESSGRSSWRWMARRSRMLLAPIRGKARLHLRLREPDGLIPLAPRIALFFNGTPLAEIRSANGLISGTWSVLARDSEPNELIIEVDRVFNARRQRQGQDDRDLGLKLDEMSWSAEIPSQR